MGWPTNWWNPSSSTSTAINNLDPDLREFLDRGSQKAEQKNVGADRASGPDPTEGQAYTSPKSSLIDLKEARPESQAASPRTNLTADNVPQESLFPDGRYAHLWKTYIPPSGGLAASATPSASHSSPTTDQDMISDLVSTVKDAQSAVAKSATENCIEEQLSVWDCSSNGSWYSRMTLCRSEQRELDRCKTMQARFLRALGYQSLYTKLSRGERVVLPGSELVTTLKKNDGLDVRVEIEPRWDAKRNLEPLERIQMHADRLYREMLDKEKAIKAAKEKGEDDLDQQQPVMNKERIKAIWPEGYAGPSLEELLNDLKPDVKETYQERLKDLDSEMRALEERVIEAELRDKRDQRNLVHEAYKEERRARLERQKNGVPTIGDRLKWLAGWSQDPIKD